MVDDPIFISWYRLQAYLNQVGTQYMNLINETNFSYGIPEYQKCFSLWESSTLILAVRGGVYVTSLYALAFCSLVHSSSSADVSGEPGRSRPAVSSKQTVSFRKPWLRMKTSSALSMIRAGF